MQKHTISFRHAISGIYTALLTQANIRVHLLIASLVLIAGVALELAHSQLIDLMLTISLVITTELINTSLESTCDAITIKHHPQIKIAKDVAAGAVLFSAFFAALIGLTIFIPHLLPLL